MLPSGAAVQVPHREQFFALQRVLLCLRQCWDTVVNTVVEDNKKCL